MENVATAPRGMWRISARRLANFAFRASRSGFAALRGRPSRIESVLVYPPVHTRETGADLMNRLKWYLSGSGCRITLPTELPLSSFACADAVPRAQRVQDSLDLDVEVIPPIEAPKRFSQTDAILLWKASHFLRPSIWSRANKVFMVDPLFYSMTECITYTGLSARVFSGVCDVETSRSNYRSFYERFKGIENAFLFATGPSIDSARDFDYPAESLRVICNSLVRNRDLLDHIKPNVVAFSDLVFHLGPSEYAARFRRDAMDAIERYDCWCIVQDLLAPLLLARYPFLAERLIGLPVRPVRGHPNFPTPDRFYADACRTSIMTTLMLPVGSAVARNVYLLGNDGRKPDEKYFWRHSSASQYVDLMATVVDTHPSFFRDRVYADYYDGVVRNIEQIILYGESLGIRYYSLTPSYVQVLCDRHVEGIALS